MSAPGDNLPLVTGMLEALTDRVRAEREGRLRAEARVRDLEEALGEALEASREPRAEKAIAAIRKYMAFDANPPDSIRGVPSADARRSMARTLLWILDYHGFGGGS